MRQRFDALEKSVQQDTSLQLLRTRIGIGVRIRNTVQILLVEAFGIYFYAQLVQNMALWNL